MKTSSQNGLSVRRRVLVGAGALILCLPAAWTSGLASVRRGRPRGGPEIEALQVIADVVLIGSRCRQVDVDQGRLLDFARANGIDPVDIMPTGARRASFDAAYERRARDTTPERLCGDLAAARAALIPGVFTTR